MGNPTLFDTRPCCSSVSCPGKYITPLIERGDPQHPAHGGVTFLGILFMTWRAQGVMNGWLLVFLFEMCCHKASWAVVRLVTFQGVRLKPCMLSPFGGNFWPCLSRVNFSHFFYPSTLSSETNSSVKELLFIIPLCKKDKAFCLCLFDN